jgi:hypothetical protein
MDERTNTDDRIFTPGLWAVLAFTVAYTVLSIVGASSRGNSEFLIYIGVMAALIAVVGFVHFRVRLSILALWGLSLWGLAHMAGGLVAVPAAWPINGEIRVLYSLWLIPGYLKYDNVIHAYGFGITTWVCWQGLRSAIQALGPVRPSFGLMVLCATAGMGFGSVNEVIEFAATLLVPETNVGGFVNTGWDLVSNLCGATTAAVLIWCCEGRGGD